ncbi:MAG TPA: hypothetical protein VNU19_10130 [Candidatus Acidoferrum sp.]|nr:hypothetical protein [Candidatus Acidoferrum sp.]
MAWELPRTVLQPHSQSAADWRNGSASPPPENFPLAAGVIGDLSRVASEEQFELGLEALASGLANGISAA